MKAAGDGSTQSSSADLLPPQGSGSSNYDAGRPVEMSNTGEARTSGTGV
jgi:hypothetical protein